MDDFVGTPEESQGESADVDGVAGRDDGDVVSLCGAGDPGGGEDRRAGCRAQESVEVVGRPVVRVLMGDHDPDQIGEVVQGRRERPGVDQKGLLVRIETEAACSNLVTRMEESTPSARPRQTYSASDSVRHARDSGEGGVDLAQ